MQQDDDAVLIDAGVMLAIVLPMAYSDRAESRLRQWKKTRTTLITSVLMDFEFVAGLRGAVGSGVISKNEAEQALSWVQQIKIVRILPDKPQHEVCLGWEGKAKGNNTFIAYYFILAEARGVVFWTADQSFARIYQEKGMDRVRWIGE